MFPLAAQLGPGQGRLALRATVAFFPLRRSQHTSPLTSSPPRRPTSAYLGEAGLSQSLCRLAEDGLGGEGSEGVVGDDGEAPVVQAEAGVDDGAVVERPAELAAHHPGLVREAVAERAQGMDPQREIHLQAPYNVPTDSGFFSRSRPIVPMNYH